MNLGKLLGLGKSFFGKDPAAAYRLNKRSCLPKFNEGKNPFGFKPTAPPPEAAADADKFEAKKAELAKSKAPAPWAFKPVLRPGARLTQPLMAPTAKPMRAGWTTRLNPFHSPEPAAEPRGVQEELSLNAVKVVHNDLADADVDVVPLKSHHEAEPTAPVLPPARRAWEYLGENLMKSS